MTGQTPDGTAIPGSNSPSGELDQRWFVLGAVVLYYAFRWQTLSEFARAIDHADVFFCDFVNHFYPQGRAIFTSSQRVWGFYYSPFAALVCGVIALLPFSLAEILWGGLQVAGLLGLYVLPLKEFPEATKTQKSLYTFLFLTSIPVLHNFKWGQISVFLTVGMVAALYYYRRDRKVLSAFILALAVSVKIYPAILLVYFLIRRDFRYVLTAGIMTLIFSVVVPVIVLGYEGMVHFSGDVLSATTEAVETWVPRDINSQSFPHVFGRMLDIQPMKGAHPALILAGFVVAAAAIFLLVKSLGKLSGHKVLPGLTLLFAVIPFFAPTSWSHYFVFLPMVQLYTMSGVITPVALKGLLNVTRTILWLGAFILTNVGLLFFAGEWDSYIHYGPVLWADLLMILLVLVQLLFDRERVPENWVV